MGLKTDGTLSKLAEITLPARIAMHDVVTELKAYAARQEALCAMCGHRRLMHGDPQTGCLECPPRYGGFLWMDRKVNHDFVEPSGG